MALTGIEWVVIGIIVVVIFLWGPSKIPELARSVGRARREFSQAKQEIENPISSAPAPVAPAPMVASRGDDLLYATAEALGIPTEGKTPAQVSEEIIRKTSGRQPS